MWKLRVPCMSVSGFHLRTPDFLKLPVFWGCVLLTSTPAYENAHPKSANQKRGFLLVSVTNHRVVCYHGDAVHFNPLLVTFNSFHTW